MNKIRKIDRVRNSILSLNKENPKNPVRDTLTIDPELTVLFNDGTNTTLNMNTLSPRYLEEIAKKMRIN